MGLHLVPIVLPVCLVLSGFAIAIESPHYAVVHSESDFEIRLYSEAFWASALVQRSSFQNSTKQGFHRLYQYIHGANLNSARFPVTAPVLTSINPTTANGSICYVKIYLTAKSPPQPNSELNLEIEKWTSHCIAVRKFSGFAKDDNINKEVEALMNSLNLHFTGNTSIPEDKLSYTIAQYNSSRHQAGRLNEVWMNVPGFNAEVCSNYRRNY
ncbi:hypothetical protein KPL70_012981 [Citrus sinensis]|uniref:uncharacterized protein LOC102631388 isoform X1 n=1 Tax=Citrus sinensis TaxID=2711 RepID=UPI0003D6F5FA|nr:uncharacterized protein LOC102631388 isoform X1 [Citrus sinensis]KAH9708756.1 hypothetical protein KPL70_012981 [Citrus sinensis]